MLNEKRVTILEEPRGDFDFQPLWRSGSDFLFFFWSSNQKSNLFKFQHYQSMLPCEHFMNLFVPVSPGGFINSFWIQPYSFVHRSKCLQLRSGNKRQHTTIKSTLPERSSLPQRWILKLIFNSLGKYIWKFLWNFSCPLLFVSVCHPHSQSTRMFET